MDLGLLSRHAQAFPVFDPAEQQALVAQLDRAGGFYPSGCRFDSGRGREAEAVRFHWRGTGHPMRDATGPFIGTALVFRLFDGGERELEEAADVPKRKAQP